MVFQQHLLILEHSSGQSLLSCVLNSLPEGNVQDAAHFQRGSTRDQAAGGVPVLWDKAKLYKNTFDQKCYSSITLKRALKY